MVAANRLSILLHACLVLGLAANSLRGGANDDFEDTTDVFVGRELQGASSGPSDGPDTDTDTSSPVTTTEMVAGSNSTNISVTMPGGPDVVSSFSADFTFNSSADVSLFAQAGQEMTAELEAVLGTGAGSVEVVAAVYTVSIEYSFTGTVTENECVVSVVGSNSNIDANDVACTITTGSGGSSDAGSGGSGDGTAGSGGSGDGTSVTTTAAPVTSTANPSRRLTSSTATVVISVDDVSNVEAIATAAEGVTTFGDVAVTASEPTFAATFTFQVTSAEAIQSPSAEDLELVVASASGVTVEVSGVTIATIPEAEEVAQRGAEAGASAVWLSRALAATLVALGVFKL